MNQVIIGRFIAAERKKKGYTQKQLAEKLGLSDKTISKWETGNGFPEISLVLPLCENLDITVNELLTGMRLSDNEYKQKAEENMVKFMKEKEENKQKIKLTTITGIIASIAFIVIILVTVIYSEAIAFPVKVVLIAIACSIFGVGLYVAMQGERKIGYYQCPHCKEYFIPTVWNYTMAMHSITTRHLRCPNCDKKGWAKKVMSKEIKK